jgi:hypothetical protein
MEDSKAKRDQSELRVQPKGRRGRPHKVVDEDGWRPYSAGTDVMVKKFTVTISALCKAKMVACATEIGITQMALVSILVYQRNRLRKRNLDGMFMFHQRELDDRYLAEQIRDGLKDSNYRTTINVCLTKQLYIALEEMAAEMGIPRMSMVQLIIDQYYDEVGCPSLEGIYIPKGRRFKHGTKED